MLHTPKQARVRELKRPDEEAGMSTPKISLCAEEE
jgi:hypothetical protein